jgi:hypothetical protein
MSHGALVLCLLMGARGRFALGVAARTSIVSQRRSRARMPT